eukprot:COSAG06_NODE_2605_length_6590_cov_2.260360_6_plen_106_part_00
MNGNLLLRHYLSPVERVARESSPDLRARKFARSSRAKLRQIFAREISPDAKVFATGHFVGFRADTLTPTPQETAARDTLRECLVPTHSQTYKGGARAIYSTPRVS